MARLSLQVKRKLQISAKNIDFREIVTRAANTLQKADFRLEVDRVGAVTGTVTGTTKRALTEVCEVAREYTSAVSFFRRFAAKGGAGKARRSILDAFRTILSEALGVDSVDDAVFRLLRHFVLIEFDLMHEGATSEAEATAHLRGILDPEDAARAGDLWNRLLVIAREAAGRAGELNRENLISHLHGGFRLVASLAWEQSPQIIETDSANVTTAAAELVARARAAARADVAAFKGAAGWPLHLIALGLAVRGDHLEGRAFTVEDIIRSVEPSREFCVVAAPGTGKTTSLVQLADAILGSTDDIATFVPLNEWSTGGDDVLDLLLARPAFRGLRRGDLESLAQDGRLALMLDGWNELDTESKKRAVNELRRLRRAFPLLRIVVSTRQQATDVPIAGPTVEVQPLSEEQQLEIARSVGGEAGVKLLDAAWRTPGVRELMSIPLYLTVLLKKAPGGLMPTTKEELLSLFVAEHEQSIDHADALRDHLNGRQKDVLIALSVEATTLANTAITETNARTVISRVSDRLVAEGQIARRPEPMAVIDTLISHHTVVRSGSGSQGVLSFQHQQFLEWHASFEVGRLMLGAQKDDGESTRQLKEEVLNQPQWEEAILFACERLSRADQAGVDAVSATILVAAAIDPILAAEMIHRSADAVWSQIGETVVAFADRWHAKGTVDRAAAFMITTGKREFAPRIWPLIANADRQIYLSALRAAHRFRPTVLGDGARERLATLPNQLREDVLGELASRSGMDGMELAAELAKTDPNPEVQFSVVDALQFRRGERLVKDVLESAPPAVWSLLAKKGYVHVIADPEVSARLRREVDLAIANETNPLRRLGMLLEAVSTSSDIGAQIEALVSSADFPIKEQNAGWSLNEANKIYPKEVVTALRSRLAMGLALPLHSGRLLAQTALVDEGPIVALATNPDNPRGAADDAVTIIGPKSVGTMIDSLLCLLQNLKASGGQWPKVEADRYHRLRDRIGRTRQDAFVEAWLGRSETDEPDTIAILGNLLALHGLDSPNDGIARIGEAQNLRIVAACQRMAKTLLASPATTRHDFSELARAIGRVGRPELIGVLGRLLGEDLKRWRAAREVRSRRPRGMTAAINSDAAMSYAPQYARALAAIAGDGATELLKQYLPDPLFGTDAAFALKQIWDSQHPSPTNKRLWAGPDFSEVRVRREARLSGSEQPSLLGEAIFAAAEQLAQPSRSEAEQRRALHLANVAFSMPHGDKRVLAEALLALPLPISSKRGLLTGLVLAGEVVSADLLLEGVRAFLAEAEKNPWMYDQNKMGDQRMVGTAALQRPPNGDVGCP